ncbi:hypothetical protein E1A91_A10G240500v1 [Gossypium mustelinum]|uniref:DC1 domain-containing protein n=1 Tax=Gossypium mustelinum TaxID=34275 RepID=A0A5D2XRQ4_GOSMU|nr:hypothetical protein E1A91_A10G240500v1 [Gossypium mustelinum]
MAGLLEIHDKDGHPEHKLKLERSEVPFICGGCKELGFGLRYQCPNMNCNYILHDECGFGLQYRRPPTQKFFKKCDFQFHQQNPLLGTRICNICALDIQGFLYQCSHGDIDLHPHCANLSLTITLPDSNEVIELRENTKSRCLKCQRKERASGKVKGLSYVSSDGKLCYHVACLKEACLDNWKRGYFQLDVLANEENKILALQNLAPNQVVRPSEGQSSNAMKGIKLLITFLKLVVSAILGEPFTLVSTLFQISQN